MNKKLSKMICTALAVGFVAVPGVYAEEAAEFSLDKVVVTALRAETKDLDTPASVTVKTGEELKATGATTVIDALQFIEGINTYSQNPYGQSAGRMSSELVIRGAKKGTLVMVNGAPMNMNGLFQLDNILLENIEKVEIVRGAGSVMYGSEAFGGVINIITKTQVSNSFSTSVGSYGKRNHNLNLQLGKMAFSGSISEAGEGKKITETTSAYTNFTGSEKNSLTGTYRFDDKLVLTYTHSEDDIDKETRLKSNNTLSKLYTDKESADRVTFQYKDGTLKANLYGTFRELDYYTRTGTGGVDTDKILNTNLKTAKYGLDTNKSWGTDERSYLAGFTFEEEKYKQTKLKTIAPIVSTLGAFDRTVMSLYTQATHSFDESRKLIVGLRGQTAKVEDEKTYNQLLPQIQYNEKLGKNSSWFVNIGKAFRLPTLTELYAGTTERFKSNLNLEPESGWTYETGWKKITDKGMLKTSFFVMDFKNHIDTDSSSTFQNFESFQNQGIEVSWEQKLSDKYSFVVGGAYGNPKQKQSALKDWERAYSRVQGNLMLRYTQDKVTANLSANYTADRANNASEAFPVSFRVNYQMSPDTAIFTTMRNVLNRHDVTTESNPSAMAGHYYAAPRTFEIGVKHSF